MGTHNIFQEKVEIVSDAEVLHYTRQQAQSFGILIGAGLSAEAQVPLADQISNEIRGLLIESLKPADPDAWARSFLSWDDRSRRYATCLRKYGNAPQRVEYFRQLLKGKTPAFAHYATALLMSRRYLKGTCFTTNFDKLLENAFSDLSDVTCQPIRTQEEADFWGSEPDKCYVLKLHGDYDTHNLLNTRDETVSVEKFHEHIAFTLLRGAGLLILGAAGNEDSVQTFIRTLAHPDKEKERVRTPNLLSLGLFWGVYVGAVKPDGMTDERAADLVQHQLHQGAVSQEIVELLAQEHSERRPCAFFPVWGSGNFLFSLVGSFKDTSLSKTAELYLDHQTRLRNVFRKQKLTTEAIEKHLAKLEAQRRTIAQQVGKSGISSETVWRARSDENGIELRIMYGDITSRSMMGAEEFASVRRVVVSPEDTAISAGGGVAYGLLTKAGSRFVLNELGKLSPIMHREVAVTSAGNLPVHYILHAAAIRIEVDGSYSISADDVEATMRSVLDSMRALRIGAGWVPLMASGVGLLSHETSLEALVGAVANWSGDNRPFTINLVVYRESMISREKAGEILRRLLPTSFVLTKVEATQ